MQIDTTFEQTCRTNRPLIVGEHLSWMMYYHDGRIHVIEQAKFIIDSFGIDDEGLALCQIKDKDGKILDEKFVFLTSDRKINERFVFHLSFVNV